MAQAPGGEVLVYEAPDGGVRVDVKLDHDTVWLTQRQMGELFETTPENVLMHLKKIYADGELEELATAKDFLAVQTEGNCQVKRRLKHYNLDAIISVGYRVNSRRGVRFRQWAASTPREHLAESAPRDREVMIRLVMNMLAGPAA
ncbi:MAG: virulence RhuM family protein [Burkholderiaceae bacterium]|nr:virulence RhuM family protein [Burkholderiaceae bacterium]